MPSGTWADIEPGSDPAVLAIGCSRAEIEIVKKIPGMTVGEGGVWRCPLTWPAWVALSTIFARQPIDCSPELREWAAAKFREITERYAMRLAEDCPPAYLEPLLALEKPGSDLQLTPSQRGDAAWLLRWRRVISGGRRGNGKTPPLIRALQVLHKTGDGCPALVICPDSAPRSWQRKLAAWAPELRTVVISGSARKRNEAIDKIARGEADVGIIVWQVVRFHTRLAAYPGKAFVKCDTHGGSTGKTTAQCEVCLKALNMIRWRTVIPDECHRMADEGSKQTRAAQWLMQHAENAWPTTGTLTVNSVANLWPVLYGLDPAAWPVRSRYLDLYARQEFAYQNVGNVVLGLRPEHAEAFHLATMPFFRRIHHEIARAGQPGLADIEFRYPDMTTKQASAYHSIARAGIAELASSDLVAATAIVKFTRMCQLASAFIETYDAEDAQGFTQSGNVRMCTPSHKVADLMEFLATEEGQWIVACSTPQLVELASRALSEAGITWTKIVGGMTSDAKDAAAVAFQAGGHRVIFCTQAGGESIDLQAAQGIYWMQPDPSFAAREQMTGRGDRFGQTRAFRQVYALTPGTVDIRLFELGLDKEERHEQVTQDANLLRYIMTVQADEIYGEGGDNDTGSQYQPA
jgi:rhodanese-related sulfurtransferase